MSKTYWLGADSGQLTKYNPTDLLGSSGLAAIVCNCIVNEHSWVDSVLQIDSSFEQTMWWKFKLYHSDKACRKVKTQL